MDPKIVDKVPGSGVDLVKFAFTPSRASDYEYKFLLIARMLWDKGVGEYVTAARIVKSSHPRAKFYLLGFLDVQNPAAISRDQVKEWVSEGVVEYLGKSQDVRSFILEADCVVLPSYREGTPRALLEASAMGRPIITTDAVGCRETVVDGENGFICKTGDSEDLAQKMAVMLELTPDEMLEMGAKGREKMEREYDEQFVIDKYLNAISEILDK